MPVNTAKVQGRRQVRYASLEELLADAERLNAGPVKALGNWSAGQIYRHLATAFNGSIDGFTMTLPWYVNVVGKLFKKKLLNGQMPPGFKLPPDAAQTLAPKPLIRRGPVRVASLRRAPGARAAPSQPSRLWRHQQGRLEQSSRHARESAHEFFGCVAGALRVPWPG
jgi:hypothetical protein